MYIYVDQYIVNQWSTINPQWKIVQYMNVVHSQLLKAISNLHIINLTLITRYVSVIQICAQQNNNNGKKEWVKHIFKKESLCICSFTTQNIQQENMTIPLSRIYETIFSDIMGTRASFPFTIHNSKCFCIVFDWNNSLNTLNLYNNTFTQKRI